MTRTQETTINWLSGDEQASVFSTDKSIVAQLERAGFQVTTGGGHEYLLPVSAIRFSGNMTKTGKAKRELTPEQRTAIGVRLQTAKAAKFGLTMEQYRSLRLRPGQKPTDEQIAELTGAAKPKSKPRRKSKGTDQRARVKAAATKPAETTSEIFSLASS